MIDGVFRSQISLMIRGILSTVNGFIGRSRVIDIINVVTGH